MRVRTPFLALAAVVAAFISTSAALSPAMARSASVVEVGYADLNLDNRAGRQALDNRIAAAVQQVCSAGDGLDLRLNALSRACRDDAFEAIQGQRDAAINGARGTVRVSMAAN